MRKTVLSTAVASTLFLVGCGSSSSTDSTDVATSTGYFIDAAVFKADYETSSGIKGETDRFGRFNYREGDSVKLSIGKLKLGEVSPDTDGLVTPRALAHGDENLTSLLLRTLQALDVDGNTSNGITLAGNLLEDINETNLEEHNETSLLSLDTDLALKLDSDHDGIIDVSSNEAENHFEESLTSWNDGKRPDENETFNENAQEGERRNGNGHGNRNGNENGEENDFNLSTYPLAVLTNTQKYALAYMWNEEKLAKDLYLEVNKVQPVKQLENIAIRAEVKHEQMVEDLVERYDINITNLDTYEIKYTESELRALPAGTFAVDAIQSLYNTLYDKGIRSTKDALEVGCMVEVIDVNDLNNYITIAQEVNATDLVATFDKLRAGSYNHYWAFDKALKNMNVIDGCCSLGTVDGINYCQPTYPKKDEN